jgi:CDP-paratose 2-epimerase
MSVALITGSWGFVGSEAAAFLTAQGLDVVGNDNDRQATLLSREGSTAWRVSRWQHTLPIYRYHSLDIRGFAALEELLADVGKDLEVVIHAAAQPSPNWAARDPFTYSEQNRVGDHLWWISDMSVESDYPDFALGYDIEATPTDIHDWRGRWLRSR